MKKKTEQYNLEIIAGPCSITEKNTRQIIEQIAPMKTPNKKRAIYGTRVVGLKSRTALSADGKGVGIDYEIIKKSFNLLEKERLNLKLPSVELAEKIAKQTGLLIATEVMIPHIQLPILQTKKIFKGNVLIWNPAVNQLGWHLHQMNHYALKNNWKIGIKNAKFLGKDPLEVANHPKYIGQTSLEKTLLGLASYITNLPEDLIIIHRGVDVPGRGDFRNALIHEIVKRIKRNLPNAKCYFDPSHSYGPKMRDHIVAGIIEAMKIKQGEEYLYNGILIEAGDSPTDTEQHITIQELQMLVNKLSTFRELRSPQEVFDR